MLLPSPAINLPPAELREASPGFYRYVEAAKYAGCPEDQIRRLVKLGIVLQPRQLEACAAARLCDQDDGPTEIGYGGARGGGKSHWCVAQLTDDCLRFPGLKCLLLRKVGKSNKENFGDLIRRILKKKRVKFRYSDHEGVLRFGNGSTIILGHFQNESDIDAYLGIEYDVIAVEEATTLSESKYVAIQTCCRTSKIGWRPRMYSTTNPGGIGHAWYKARFVDPAMRGEQTDTYFIPATVDDNSFVNPGYRKVLDNLTGWLKRAWRFGDWDIAMGAFFTNFRRSVHVKVGAFDLTRIKGWWGAFDYGIRHYTCVHLMGQDGDGNVYVIDEHCERGRLVAWHANAIHSMLARYGLTASQLWQFVAGTDIFSIQEGGSVADSYKAQGIEFIKANDDRVNGAAQMLQWFGDVDAMDADGEPSPITPRLFILERCHRLIETIPILQHDPKRPEDVLKVDCDEEGKGGDDAYDCCRYGIMAVVTVQPPTGHVVNPMHLIAGISPAR